MNYIYVSKILIKKNIHIIYNKFNFRLEGKRDGEGKGRQERKRQGKCGGKTCRHIHILSSEKLVMIHGPMYPSKTRLQVEDS